MLTKTEGQTRINASSQDEFILSLNDAMLAAKTLRERLYHQMVKESGVRWGEMLEELLQAQETEDGARDAIASFISATKNYTAWMLTTSMHQFVDDERYEEALDIFLNGVREDVLGHLQDKQKRAAIEAQIEAKLGKDDKA